MEPGEKKKGHPALTSGGKQAHCGAAVCNPQRARLHPLSISTFHQATTMELKFDKPSAEE